MTRFEIYGELLSLRSAHQACAPVDCASSPPNRRRHHYEGLDCIVYVVDSSDHKRLEENRNELWMMLEAEDLKDVMLLVIANKQDKADAISAAELSEALKPEP